MACHPMERFPRPIDMDILTRPAPSADHRIHYDSGPYQFGDLWLPASPATSRLPLVVFLHGGWWQSAYDLEYAGHLCAALKAVGVATWSVEYRRVGSTGGGWPTTFQDVAAGFDFVATLAKSYPLDLNRTIAMGHSAGGHLAFWLAGRHHIPAASPIHEPQPKVSLQGLIALAGAVDLRLTCDLSGYFTFAHDKHEVYSLMGGAPSEHEDRYRAGNPGDLLPFSVPQILIQGTLDGQIPPELPPRWAEMAQHQGEQVTVAMIPGADHFDVVDPTSKAWPTVQAAVFKLLRV
jgi:acetyl esterase/lipase